MNETENLIEFSFRINSYISTVLSSFGVILNAISLIVFAYAKGKHPQIGGINYLSILTLFSIIFLIFHWYINVLPYFMSINDKLNIIETNVYACKLINYLRNVSRAAFALSTFSYSFERALAIFLPFYIIEIKNRVSAFLIFFTFILSFMSPIHFAFKYELVPTTISNVTVKTCSPSNQSHFEKLTFFFNLFAIYVPIFLVILLNFSIIFKLKNYKIEISTEALNTYNNEMLKMVNKLYEENFVLNKTRRQMNSEVSTSNSEQYFKFYASNNYINTANLTEINSIARMKKRDKLALNQKFSNTNTLVLVSTVYIVLNIPNIINLFFVFNPFLNYGLDIKIKLNTDQRFITYMLISDIFNVTNYSINGVLFFMFGKVFRFHLFNMWRNFFKRKNTINL